MTHQEKPYHQEPEEHEEKLCLKEHQEHEECSSKFNSLAEALEERQGAKCIDLAGIALYPSRSMFVSLLPVKSGCVWTVRLGL
jgi:hypothetical protein